MIKTSSSQNQNLEAIFSSNYDFNAFQNEIEKLNIELSKSN